MRVEKQAQRYCPQTSNSSSGNGSKKLLSRLTRPSKLPLGFWRLVWRQLGDRVFAARNDDLLAGLNTGEKLR
jgi:hypothetical protein